jgi:PTH1 family peptidyl-tRNA hydrolase
VKAAGDFFWFWSKKRATVCAEVIVFGIGNPGARYRNTRHNAGFMVVDSLERSLTDRKRENSSSFTAISGTLAGKKTVLVRPKTFVNCSGDAVVSSCALFGVPLGSCLVVVDDYQLPLGVIRLRRGGSDGGHNGLASIIERCGPNFPRIRLGIGPLPGGKGSVDFVLGSFTNQEKPILEAAIKNASEATVAFCSGGIEKAMNQFNRSVMKEGEK